MRMSKYSKRKSGQALAMRMKLKYLACGLSHCDPMGWGGGGGGGGGSNIFITDFF